MGFTYPRSRMKLPAVLRFLDAGQQAGQPNCVSRLASSGGGEVASISKVCLCDGQLTAARYNYVLLVAWLVYMWSPRRVGRLAKRGRTSRVGSVGRLHRSMEIGASVLRSSGLCV